MNIKPSREPKIVPYSLPWEIPSQYRVHQSPMLVGSSTADPINVRIASADLATSATWLERVHPPAASNNFILGLFFFISTRTLKVSENTENSSMEVWTNHENIRNYHYPHRSTRTGAADCFQFWRTPPPSTCRGQDQCLALWICHSPFDIAPNSGNKPRDEGAGKWDRWTTFFAVEMFQGTLSKHSVALRVLFAAPSIYLFLLWIILLADNGCMICGGQN